MRFLHHHAVLPLLTRALTLTLTLTLIPTPTLSRSATSRCTHTAQSCHLPSDIAPNSLRTPSYLQPPSPQLNIIVGDATLLGAGTQGSTLASAVARRHACVKKAVSGSGSTSKADLKAVVGERRMSLKLNTRETQVKLPGFPAPGTQIPSPKNQLPGFKGVLSEGVVHWEFGPADVSLGLAELLRGGMFGSVRGCKRGRSPSRSGAASAGPVACSIHPGRPTEPLRPLSEAAGPLLGCTHRCRRICTQAQPAPREPPPRELLPTR